MKRDTLESLSEKLAAVRAEQERQMQWVGVRLGVFAQFRTLARKEQALMKRYGALVIAQPEPSPRSPQGDQ